MTYDPIVDELTRFLRRKAPRRGLDDQAQDDEIGALVRAMHRAAPARPSAEWAADFLDQLERREKAPMWPTVADIERLAIDRRKADPGAASGGAKVERPTAAAVLASRIERGDPVSEIHLWGAEAIEAVDMLGLDPAALDRYRENALAAICQTYGEAAAAEHLARMEERLAAASRAAQDGQKAIERDREAGTAREARQWASYALRRFRNSTARVAAIALALGILGGADRGQAHEWYDPVCCNTQDCAPLAEDAIREADGGWYVTGPDGREHHVPYGLQHPTIPPDGKAHACFSLHTGNLMTRTLPGGRKVNCLHIEGGAI